MRVSAVALLATVAATLAAFVLPGAATSAPPGCANRTNTTYQQLLDVRDARGRARSIRPRSKRSRTPTMTRSRPELAPLERRATTAASRTCAGLLERRRATPSRSTSSRYEFAGAALQQTAPISATYATGAFTGSGEGNVSAAVTPVDIVPRAAARPGHERLRGSRLRLASPPGNIALMQRGTCSFGDQGSERPDGRCRSGRSSSTRGTPPTVRPLIVGTLLPDGAAVTIPVVGASFADGRGSRPARIDRDRPRGARAAA